MAAADRRQPGRESPLLLVRRIDEREPPCGGPPDRLPVPLGEAHPDIPVPAAAAASAISANRLQIGTSTSPFSSPEQDRIEADRDAPRDRRPDRRPAGESEPGLRRYGRRSRLSGRPAQPRDGQVQIELIIAGQEIPQARGVSEEMPKVLRPEDERMDGLPGSKIDLLDAASTARELRPAGPAMPPASHSGKDATRSVRRDALMTVFRVYSLGRNSLSPRVSPRKNLNRKK